MRTLAEPEESAAVHDRISDLVMVHGGISALENPLRSMTWLDPYMSEWVHHQAPFTLVASACDSFFSRLNAAYPTSLATKLATLSLHF